MFGISEKKKRGIVVPVMALAVCAVAMVGLGFALETSVTSTTNDVNIFQVDLNDNDSTLGGQKTVGTTGVNGLLDLTITTEKTQDGVNNPVIEYAYDGSTFIKIFTNNTDYNNPALNVSASFIEGSKITAVSISLYEKSETTYSSLVAKATTDVDNGSFKLENQSNKIKANTVYKLVITGITTNTPLDKDDSSEKITFTFEASVA